MWNIADKVSIAEVIDDGGIADTLVDFKEKADTEPADKNCMRVPDLGATVDSEKEDISVMTGKGTDKAAAEETEATTAGGLSMTSDAMPLRALTAADLEEGIQQAMTQSEAATGISMTYEQAKSLFLSLLAANDIIIRG